jgi:hypothetical protein
MRMMHIEKAQDIPPANYFKKEREWNRGQTDQ